MHCCGVSTTISVLTRKIKVVFVAAVDYQCEMFRPNYTLYTVEVIVFRTFVCEAFFFWGTVHRVEYTGIGIADTWKSTISQQNRF
jgi:hypothetical protein